MFHTEASFGPGALFGARGPTFRPLPCSWSAEGRWVRVELPPPSSQSGGHSDGDAPPPAVSALHFPRGWTPKHASAAIVGEEGGAAPAAWLLVIFEEGPALRFRTDLPGPSS